MTTVTEGALAWTGHLNVDNAAGTRLLTVGREPDGSVLLVARGRLDCPGGNTVRLSAEDAATLAGYLTGNGNGEGAARG